MGREVSGRRLVAEVPFEGRAEDERTVLMERSGAAGRAQGFITIHFTSQNRKQMFGMHLLRHARAKIICAWVPSFWAGMPHHLSGIAEDRTRTYWGRALRSTPVDRWRRRVI